MSLYDAPSFSETSDRSATSAFESTFVAELTAADYRQASKFTSGDDRQVASLDFNMDIFGPEVIAETTPQLPPAMRFDTALKALDDNPSQERMRNVVDIVREQETLSELARKNFFDYPGRETMISQLEPALNKFAKTLPENVDPAIINNLAALPDYILSGQATEAAAAREALRLAFGGTIPAGMQEYLDSINSFAQRNPEFVQQYTGLQQTWTGSMRVLDNMYRKLNGE